MDAGTGERLERALTGPDVWGALGTLASDPPPDLVEAVEERYGAAGPEQRRLLTWLLRSLGESGDPALLRLLERARGEHARDVLATAVQRGLRIPAGVLRGLVDDLGMVEPVVDAMGLSGDPSFAPLLAGVLDRTGLGGRAALALGRLGERRWTGALAERVGGVSGLDHTAFARALELMGDPAAVPYLVRWLRKGGEPAGDVHDALVRITGRNPLLPLWTTSEEYTRNARRAWAGVTAAGRVPPDLRDMVVESPSWARFELDEGRGRIRIDFDAPAAGSSRPRWNRSLFVGGEPLYRVGSICDTCETALRLLDWPARRAVRGAARLRGALSDVHALDAELLDASRPLLEELETGHYRVFLADLPLERVATPERSWWVRRWEDRTEADLSQEPDPVDWPGTEHFQLTHRLTEPVPTYGVVLPSQPLDALDDDQVAGHRVAIEGGARPAALVLGWVEDRWVEAEHEERFLVGTVLDGHHKLAAYAEAGVPARVVLLSRLEDNWAERDGWGARLEAVLPWPGASAG
ncbi:hypothetical protein ABT173_45860 [Streptomyces sp. NPDC001795]|uniref:hypothetical protein n=1 Tax=Streptomyces sp. NPDC001795 TaxID=3154525 RepID=UPI00331C895E